MVNAYLFDIGNVILAFDFSKAARRVSAHSPLSPEEIYAATTPLIPKLEIGALSLPDFLSQVIQRINFTADESVLREAFADIFTPNQPMIDFIRAQHAKGIPLHLLSNTSEIHVSFFEATYPIFECFEGRIYSYQVEAMKPDPAIYEIAIETLGLEPDKTIYIDDLEANVAGGSEAGLRSIQYRLDDHAGFLEEIGRLE